MIILVWVLVLSLILAALAAAYAALRWAAHVRRLDRRSRRYEARVEAQRLAPICEMELTPLYRTRAGITDRLAGELERRGYEGADDLAADAVAEMMAERT